MASTIKQKAGASEQQHILRSSRLPIRHVKYHLFTHEKPACPHLPLQLLPLTVINVSKGHAVSATFTTVKGNNCKYIFISYNFCNVISI